MVTPIFVSEHGDLYSFDRSENAEAYLEPDDVTNEEYCAFDAVGQVLRLRLTANGALRGEQLRVKLEPTGRYDVAKLREVIVEYLRAVAKPTDDYVDLEFAEQDLAELVRDAHRYARRA